MRVEAKESILTDGSLQTVAANLCQEINGSYWSNS